MNQYIEAATLKKSFGVAGHIRVSPLEAMVPHLLSAEVWFIKGSQGVIPYFVEEVELDKKGGVVKFEDITDPQTAKEITGSLVFLRSKDLKSQPQDTLDDLGMLLGYLATDVTSGLRGVIVRVERYPQQLMATIKDADDREYLFPLVADLITDLDPEQRVMTIAAPSGLFDI